MHLIIDQTEELEPCSVFAAAAASSLSPDRWEKAVRMTAILSNVTLELARAAQTTFNDRSDEKVTYNFVVQMQLRKAARTAAVCRLVQLSAW
jgi:hypothetical protein